MRLAALRALLPAVAAAALLSGTSTAGAQTVTASTFYAPSCGPSTPCTLLRFVFANAGASSVLFNTLTLTSTAAPFRFAPPAGGIGLYQAVDAIGPFGGASSVGARGGQLVIDFLGGNGFAFELDPGTRGYVEVPLAQAPALVNKAFTFEATLDGGGAVSGTITPEPATIALFGGGLALIGFASRRRRRA